MLQHCAKMEGNLKKPKQTPKQSAPDMFYSNSVKTAQQN